MRDFPLLHRPGKGQTWIFWRPEPLVSDFDNCSVQLGNSGHRQLSALQATGLCRAPNLDRQPEFRQAGEDRPLLGGQVAPRVAEQYNRRVLSLLAAEKILFLAMQDHGFVPTGLSNFLSSDRGFLVLARKQVSRKGNDQIVCCEQSCSVDCAKVRTDIYERQNSPGVSCRFLNDSIERTGRSERC